MEAAQQSATGARAPSARERILDTAYDLFSRYGTRAVGVDRIIAECGIAKMTLYRNFASKDELILAFLERRDERWTHAWLQGEAEQRADTPAGRLLAIFDVFGDWFATEGFEGCSFIDDVMLEVVDPENPVRQATVRHLASIRAYLRGLAQDAGVPDPDGFAHQWHILMKGCIVAAGEGDAQAARRARDRGVAARPPRRRRAGRRGLALRAASPRPRPPSRRRAAAWPPARRWSARCPRRVEEKPHCGDRHSCSTSTNSAGLLDAALQVVLGLQLAALGGHQAEHDELALRARSAAARSRPSARRRTPGRSRRRRARRTAPRPRSRSCPRPPTTSGSCRGTCAW